ncbi:MAG TPA: TetR/AcrR family transcriptional regulator [Gemmatimonadaceae bacterium]
MARPREFDEQQALDGALDVFWRCGYEGASLAQLLDATGLSKSSLYETFGDKRRLFLTAFDLYQERQLAQLEELLRTRKPARRSIERFLRRVVHRPSNPWGCMVCNEAVELGPHDPDIAKRIARHLERVEAVLTRVVERGQRDGSIGTRSTARALARFLVMSWNGLQVLVRAKSSQPLLDDALALALSALD